MKRATFFFRNGGIIITEIRDENGGESIGRRLCAGGSIVGKDSIWGKSREVAINLGDVAYVILEKENDPQASG